MGSYLFFYHQNQLHDDILTNYYVKELQSSTGYYKDENTIYFVNGVPAEGGAVDISTLVARIEALEAKLSGMTN